MPQGGTLGLGTIALLLASYHLGWQLGLITAMLSVLIQFVTGQMYILGFTQFLLDYFIAFSVYGIACLFPNWKYFYSGVLITNLIRFLSSTISGVVFYGVTPVGIHRLSVFLYDSDPDRRSDSRSAARSRAVQTSFLPRLEKRYRQTRRFKLTHGLQTAGRIFPIRSGLFLCSMQKA